MKKLLSTIVIAVGFCVATLGLNAQVCNDIFNNITPNSSFYNLSVNGVPLFDGANCGPLFVTPANLLVTGDLVQFNVTCGNTYTWTTCGLGGFDSYMRLFDFATLSLLAENDDDFSCGANIFASTLTWLATQNGQVWLSVNEYLCDPNGQQPYDMLMQCVPGNGCSPPVNDEVCNATFLGVPTPQSVSGSWDNTFATPDGPSPGPGLVGPAPSCDALDGWCSFETTVDNDLWFAFIAPPTGNVDIEAITTDLFGDTQIALWQIDDCFSASFSAIEVAANDDGGNIFMSRIFDQCGAIQLTPGELYYIQIDGYAGWTGTGDIFVTEVPAGSPTPNDEPVNAVVVPTAAPGASSAVPFNNVCATATPISPGPGTIGNFPSCDAVDGWCSFETATQNDVWFTYTLAAGSGGSIQFDSQLNLFPFDTQIAVWDANGDASNLAGFIELGGNDDGGNLFSSSLTLDCLEPGSTVYIQVDGFAGSEGDGTVTVTDLGVAPLEVDAGPCATVYFTGCENLAAYGCTELTATAMGGTAGYSFLWSTGDTTASITVCPDVNTTYTVSVSDQRGCSVSDDVFVSSIDVTCGPPQSSSSSSSSGSNSGSSNSSSGSSDHGSSSGSSNSSSSSSSDDCTESGVVLCVNPNLFASSSSSGSSSSNGSSGSSDDGGSTEANSGSGSSSSGSSSSGSSSSGSNDQLKPTYNICVACGCAAEYLELAGYSLGACNQIDCEDAQSNPQPGFVNGKPKKCKSGSGSSDGGSSSSSTNVTSICYGKPIYKGFCRSESSGEKPCIGSGSGYSSGSNDKSSFSSKEAGSTMESITAYPNPFDQSTTIAFTLSEDLNVKVEIYDITGVRAATLFDGRVDAGSNKEVVFDGNNHAAGIYLYKISISDGTVVTDKLYLTK